MSSFTDHEHEWALRDTLYWLQVTPATREAEFEYGQYQYRLKDYREAVAWYRRAVEKSFIPAMYKLAYCLRHQLGCRSCDKEAIRLFQQVVECDEQKSDEPEACYRLGMCYTYGYGVGPDETKGMHYFSRIKETNADAWYEIGLGFLTGKGEYAQDRQKAEQCFRQAYDGFCEEAVFTLFTMFTGPFDAFPYIREIKEAYSFKLGRLLRVAELKPCEEYWTRLADFYQQGYPGDTGEKLDKFHRLARKYYRKAGESRVEQSITENNYSKFART